VGKEGEGLGEKNKRTGAESILTLHAIVIEGDYHVHDIEAFLVLRESL
jgi:hypothetical protein